MYSTRPSSVRLEFDIDTRWLKWAAITLAGLGFCWLVLVILRAVLSAANDVVLTVQHATPALQMVVAALLFAGMLMAFVWIAVALWNRSGLRKWGGVV